MTATVNFPLVGALSTEEINVRRANLIVRRVTVDRTRTPQTVLDATGLKQYINDPEVVTTMPGGGEGTQEVDVYFFHQECGPNNDQLEKIYESYGLVPADSYEISAVHEDDPSFALRRPNATLWRGSDGHWRVIIFAWWFKYPDVTVRKDSSDHRWHPASWFAGVMPRTLCG